MSVAGPPLALSGNVDDISVVATPDGGDALVAAVSSFIGRWWTGSVVIAVRNPGGALEVAAEAKLRAGVAAVTWLPCEAGSTSTPPPPPHTYKLKYTYSHACTHTHAYTQQSSHS